MNFLAHAYLSFNHPEIVVGNMISDFVKGRKKWDYPEGIQKGIELHRLIDNFTDSHDTTREAKEVFRPAVRLYAGAFVDVAYDHFLANDANEFSDLSLQQQAQSTYLILSRNNEYLPEVFQRMLPYMRSQNWLYNYKSLSGAESSFGGLVRRSQYLFTSTDAFDLFCKHYHTLQNCYNNFFPSVKAMATAYLQHLPNH